MAGRSQTGFVAYLYLMSGPGGLGEKRRDDFLYLAYAADGKYRRSLARLPGFESFTMEVHLPGRPEPLRSQGRPPFSRLPLSWVHGDRFYYGSSYYFEVAVYDLDGEMTQLVGREVAREPVTSAMISDYKKQFSTTSESAPRMVPGVDDLPYPDSLPPYRRLWVDREGWLWIQRYDAPSDTVVTWSVFNPNGRWETDVVVPRTWQIQDIGMDYVLALIRDDLDIERIGRFALSRRE